MDDVELAWATVLDYEAFSVRVTEKDLQNLYSILTAIPNERIAAMQVGSLWPLPPGISRGR